MAIVGVPSTRSALLALMLAATSASSCGQTSRSADAAGGASGEASMAGARADGGARTACQRTPETECRECTCLHCAEQVESCLADRGCSSINDCADEFLCNEADCYVEGVCKDVIDSKGGPKGAAMKRVIALWRCVNQAHCVCIDGEF